MSVSLKGINGNDFNTAREMLCSVIGTEAMRFQKDVECCWREKNRETSSSDEQNIL